MDRINYQRMHYFLTVGSLLNFTEAAKKLYISQPALSKQIAALEKEVGIKLFRRSTKQVELSEGGRVFYQHCQKAYADMEAAIAMAKEATENCVYKIRIGLLEMGGVIDYVMPLIDAFSEDEHGVELEYYTYGFKQLKHKLKENELDLIFTLNTELPRDGYDIVTETIADLQLCIVVPERNKLYDRTTLMVKELEEETICTFSDAYSDEARRSIIKHCKRDGFTPSRMKVYPNIQSMMIGMTVHGDVTIGYKDFFKEIADQVRFFEVNDEMGGHSIVIGYKNSGREDLEKVLKHLVLNDIPY